MSWTSDRRIQAGSFRGTQRIFSSGPFSSAMWNTPTTRPRMRQPGNVGFPPTTRGAGERVAPPPQRALDESVGRGIRHRREEASIEDDDTEVLVELVLVPRPRCNLHEDDHVLGHGLRLDEVDGGLQHAVPA